MEVSLVVEPLRVQLVPCGTFFPCSVHFVHPITRKKQPLKSCSILPSPQGVWRNLASLFSCAGNQLLFLLNFTNSEDRMHLFCISLHYAKYSGNSSPSKKTILVPSDHAKQALVACDDAYDILAFFFSDAKFHSAVSAVWLQRGILHANYERGAECAPVCARIQLRAATAPALSARDARGSH